ncbi:uncharacterized protein JCM10292_003704 [Rhodotorula paludigena]|uniref:uncharacterized protein n=1 Tax=Rhodotorula paludigena TaxID=86838 RepID=UPI00317965A6
MYSEEEDDLNAVRSKPVALNYGMPAGAPRSSYLKQLEGGYTEDSTPVKPKSKLLITDLDNTLFGPSGDGVIARPYLKTFIKYIMHPDTPYQLAIWTFSGRMYGIAHLRQVGMGKYLFDSDDLTNPKFKLGLVACWGYEDSGFETYGRMASGKAVKDLELMWDMLNVTTGSNWTALNSLIQDDQVDNGRAQPDSIVNCPVFTAKCLDDDFLLAQIGVLDELAHDSNFAASIQKRGLERGPPVYKLEAYVKHAREVCSRLGIKVSRGAPYPDPEVIDHLHRNASPVGPAHDAAEEPPAPHPGSLPLPRPHPSRVAEGLPLVPSALYKQEAAVPSRIDKVRKPLVIFDLDGTLYTRPPQHLEHIPDGEPSGRPYLRTFLTWLLRPESPWSMAIWTGSQKATAVQCLYELDLGLVGPQLVDGEAELLHPKLLALWAREDLGLTKKDYVSYVSIVKDLDKMWSYLAKKKLGNFDPSNTVMVDDTPSKLRAQPSTLIAAPTYDYPLGPSIQTNTAQMDSLLLALVDILDLIAPQSNFAAFVAKKRWNVVPTRDEIADERNEGVRILKRDGVPVEAEGRGLIPGAMRSKAGDAYGRTAGRTMPRISVLNSIYTAPSDSSARPPSMTTAGTTVPLTHANLASIRAVPIGTQTDEEDDNRTDTTASSVNGDNDDAAQEAQQAAANGSARIPVRGSRRMRRTASWASDDHSGYE